MARTNRTRLIHLARFLKKPDCDNDHQFALRKLKLMYEYLKLSKDYTLFHKSGLEVIRILLIKFYDKSLNNPDIILEDAIKCLFNRSNSNPYTELCHFDITKIDKLFMRSFSESCFASLFKFRQDIDYFAVRKIIQRAGDQVQTDVLNNIETNFFKWMRLYIKAYLGGLHEVKINKRNVDLVQDLICGRKNVSECYSDYEILSVGGPFRFDVDESNCSIPDTDLYLEPSLLEVFVLGERSELRKNETVKSIGFTINDIWIKDNFAKCQFASFRYGCHVEVFNHQNPDQELPLSNPTPIASHCLHGLPIDNVTILILAERVKFIDHLDPGWTREIKNDQVQFKRIDIEHTKRKGVANLLFRHMFHSVTKETFKGTMPHIPQESIIQDIDISKLDIVLRPSYYIDPANPSQVHFKVSGPSSNVDIPLVLVSRDEDDREVFDNFFTMNGINVNMLVSVLAENKDDEFGERPTLSIGPRYSADVR
jgi:hypothetical protein